MVATTLYADNHEARKAFRKLQQEISDEKGIRGIGPLPGPPACTKSMDASDSSAKTSPFLIETHSRPNKRRKLTHEDIQETGGFFRLMFREIDPQVRGWFIGSPSNNWSGTDTGDIPIVDSQSSWGLGVDSPHASIFVHPTSGVLMIQCESQWPITLLNFDDGEDVDLCEGESCPLCDHSTRLRIGKLRYAAVFPSDENSTWTSARDEIMRQQGLQKPSWFIKGVPQMTDNIRTRVFVFHSAIGSGAFGNVYAGIMRKNGDPVAVKKMPAQNAFQISAEITFHKRFDVSEIWS